MTKVMAENAAVRRAIARTRDYNEAVAAAVSAALAVTRSQDAAMADSTVEMEPVGSPPRALAVAAPPAPPAAAAPRSSAGNAAQSRGKGRSWTLEERTALAKAYTVATLNGVAGTDQTKEEFWEAVFEGFSSQCPSGMSSYALVGRWRNRTPTAAMTEFLRNVGPCSQRFAHFYHVANSDKLTGNLSDADVMLAARGLYSASSAYAAVRKDSEQEDKRDKSGKGPPQRRARMVPENWQPCWEQLRVLEKWSGVKKNPEIEALVAAETGEQTNEMRRSGGAGPSTPHNSPATGNKAVKRTGREAPKSDDDAFTRAIEKSNEAIMVIATSMSKRSSAGEAAQDAENRRVVAEYFNQEGVRDTAEARAFRAELHQEMLALGRTALRSARKRRADGTPSASSDADALTAALPSRDPRGTTPASTRGTNSFATKAKRAMLQSPTIDLTGSPPPLVVTEVGVSETEDEEELDFKDATKSTISSGDEEDICA